MQHYVMHGPYIPRCSQRLLCSWGAPASRPHALPHLPAGAHEAAVVQVLPPVRAHQAAAAAAAAPGLAQGGSALLSPELRASSLLLLLHESFKRAAGRWVLGQPFPSLPLGACI